MICTCLSIVLTKFLGGVCLTMRLEVSSHFVMAKHVGVFQWEENAAKFLKCDFYWPTLFKEPLEY